MGNYSIRVDGVTVTVKTAESESPTLIENQMSEFRRHLDSNVVKVVGVDIINKKSDGNNSIPPPILFVLYTSKHCVVFHMNYVDDLHKSVKTLFKDSSICFVGPAKLYNGLTTAPLADIAREVGVEYNAPETGTKNEVRVDSKNPMVLNDEMMKSTIYDAVAHYNICCSLLIRKHRDIIESISANMISD